MERHGPNAGFTTGTPWIKVNPNYREINVEQALADPDSVFHYYQRLIALRHTQPVIVHGVYDIILADHPQIYAFTRTLGDQRLLVLLNFSGANPRGLSCRPRCARKVRNCSSPTTPSPMTQPCPRNCGRGKARVYRA